MLSYLFLIVLLPHVSESLSSFISAFHSLAIKLGFKRYVYLYWPTSVYTRAFNLGFSFVHRGKILHIDMETRMLLTNIVNILENVHLRFLQNPGYSFCIGNSVYITSSRPLKSKFTQVGSLDSRDGPVEPVAGTWYPPAGTRWRVRVRVRVSRIREKSCRYPGSSAGTRQSMLL
jgi:hypothetical protein